MTKEEMINKIFEKAELPSKEKTKEALDAVITTIQNALVNGENITLTGFGSLKVYERAERQGRNPRTKEPITIPACKVIKFTPGKTLKEAINK